MKKLLKKTLAIALAATIALGAGPLAGLCGLELPSISTLVSAAEEEPVWTDITDMLDVDGTTIRGIKEGFSVSGNIEIPVETSNGTAITAIADNAFKNCSELTAVKIPDGIISIGEDAFSNCSNLTTVYFNANGCETDYHGILRNNNNFTKIVFGENVSKIPDDICENAKALQTVDFKGIVTVIGYESFKECSSLKAVDLSDVTTIGTNAFMNCTSIKTVTFSENLETVGDSAFSGCKMTEITIPANTKEIGEDAFSNCSNLTTVYFNANGCETDYHGILRNNNNFTKIVFGENVSKIPDDICENAKALQTVEFKGDVTVIGYESFKECSSLKAIDLSDVTTIGTNAFMNCTAIKTFAFSENLETVGDGAFSGCKMTDITIPANTKIIGEDAFSNCSNLTTVYFNANGCETDYHGIFTNNNNFTKIVFGENVSKIPDDICENATALKTVVLNGKVTEIGYESLKNCTSLENIHLTAYSEETFDFDALTIGEGNDVVTEDIFTFGLIDEPGEPEIPDEPETEEIEKKDEKFGVSVSYMNNAFDEEVDLKVVETTGDHEKGSVYIVDREIRENVGCFNIKMVSVETGATVQPAGGNKVKVTMPIPEKYIGKKDFRIVHELDSGARENLATNAKNPQNMIEISADGKYLTFSVSNFSKFEVMTFTALPTVSIKNNNGTKTINYGDVLRLTANAENLPADAKIFWYVDGVKKGEGTTFDVSFENGTVEVTVKVVDANGNDYADTEISDSQKVTVKSGFFQKIISFLKNLFGISRIVSQLFMTK